MKLHLPIRTGHRGLHLAEAVGLMVRDMSKPMQLEFLYQSGIPMTDSEVSFREQNDKEPTETALRVASVRFNELCLWFDKQLAELKELCSSTESVERYLLPINDSKIERIAMALILTSFGDVKTKKKEGGIFSKLSNLFKR